MIDPGHVLVVEDDADARRALQIQLRAGGWQVSLAPDAETAGRLAASANPDVVLLDLGLPGRDGYSLLADLKASRLTKDVPVVVLTARSATEAADRAYELGATAYLQKPVDRSELFVLIRTLAARQSTPREA